MKIITLLPVKNESWILRFSLKNFSIFSDEIIILDDNSIDDLKIIAQEFPKVRIIPFSTTEKFVDMSLRRNILLSEGRLAGGTHFIFLDADEIISDTFSQNFRDSISNMNPGDTLYLPWIFVAQENEELCFDSKEKTNYKDFIFCDDKKSIYQKQFLSEARTPGDRKSKLYIPFEKGYVLHFQNLARKRNQLKQAWYRCNELIEGSRSAQRINATYDHTKKQTIRNRELLQDKFTITNFEKIDQNAGYDFYINQITNLFKQKNITFFESLDVWHISELRELFINKVGKCPKAKTFPVWLLFLNKIKNKIKNDILN